METFASGVSLGLAALVGVSSAAGAGPWTSLRVVALAQDPAHSEPEQEPKPVASPPDDPKKLEDLQKALDALRRAHDAEIADLRDEIDKLAEESAESRRKAATPSQQTLSVFNPAITAFGNFLYRSDDSPVYVDDDPAGPRIDDRFSFREAELDIRAPIDPWADGVLIASFEAETPGEFSTGIEEGYVVLKKLPFLDSAPAGLKLKLGRFRPAFGRFNTLHLHDLPAPTYPLALRTFLGPEGFSADGISAQFFLPCPGPDDVLDATLQVVDGGEIAVSPDGDPSDLATLAHVKWFRDLAPGRDLEIGASAWSSNAENQLYGLDATYRWKPYVAGEWKSFLVGAEVFQADLGAGGFAPHPGGFDLWTQYQLDRNLYVGARYGRADDLVDDALDTETYGAFLTYYTTEFLRFRVGLEHTESYVAALDGVDTAYFEMNFVYGSHPAEPYWVNR
jgi:hypothetical protein